MADYKNIISRNGVIINEDGLDSDTRIESDTNANAFFLSGSGAGNIGIGTNLPSAKFHIYQGDAFPLAFRLENTTGAVEISSNGTNIDILSSFVANSLSLSTNNTQRIFISPAGNVGIGTAIPAEQLQITGNFRLPLTTATVGQIKQGAITIFHTYTESNPNIFIGEGAGNFTLDLGNNIGIGQNSLSNLTSGGFNTVVGSSAGTGMTTGSDNSLFGNASGPAITTGERNVGMGQNSLFTITTASNNTAVGTNAGRIITGEQNTFLGSSAGFTGTTAAITNSTGIGYNAQVTASNTMVLGNGVTVVLGATAPVDATNKLEVIGKTLLNGGQAVKRTASAAGAYTILLTDYIIGKTGITGGGDTVNLPTAASAGVGKVFIIKDESGTAATNNITIDPNGAELIDGAATFVMNTNYQSITIYCNGSAFFII